MKTRLLSLGRALLAISTVAGATAFAAPDAAVGATNRTLDPSLDIVGGPVAAGNVAVVIAVANNKHLIMAGIDPASGHVDWQRPYSTSDVTPGVAPTPFAIGTTVIDLVPSGKVTNSTVNVEAIDAVTGSVLWGLSKFDLSDFPAPCPGNTLFCVVAINPDGSSSLAALDPKTGNPVNILDGPNRGFSQGLYQTDANTPTLQFVSATGTSVWTKTVTSLFGPGYDPNYGWDLNVVGNEIVGTVSAAPSGKTYNLDRDKTVGIDAVSGTPQWSVPGDYQCEGPLAMLSTDVLCQFHGKVTNSTSPAQFVRTVTTVLAGFNPANGAVTWSQPVRNAMGYQTGSNLAFVDGTSLVVTLSSGATVVLNTANGSITPVTKGETFWCENSPFFNSGASKNITSDGEHTSSPVFYGCSATGKALGHTPTSTPDTVGTTVDGAFLWPTTHGLGARVVGAVQA